MPDENGKKKSLKAPIANRNTDFDAKILKSKAELPKGAVYAGKDENGQDIWEVRTKNEAKSVSKYKPKNNKPSTNKSGFRPPRPKKEETFGETIEKFTIPPPEVVPPKQTNLYGEVQTYAKALDKNSANQDWIDYEFASPSGNTTNEAVKASFDNSGKHFTFDKDYNKVYSGKTIDDFRNNSIQQIETPQMSGVNKPNLIDNNTFSQKGIAFTKNASGGLGVNKSTLGTDLKGATDTYIPKQYDSLGIEKPTDSGLKPLGTSLEGKEVGKLYPTEIKGNFKKGGIIQKLQRGGGVRGDNNGDGFLDGKESADLKTKQDNNKNNASGVAGAVGSAYYSSQKPENEGDVVYNQGMQAVGQIGPVGKIIQGGAAVGDMIGKPVRNNAEQIDSSTGTYKDVNKATVIGSVGATLNPFKAQTTVLSDKEASNETKAKFMASNLLTGGLGTGLFMGSYYKDKDKAMSGRAKDNLNKINVANKNAKMQQLIQARNSQEENPMLQNTYDTNGLTYDKNQNVILANGQQFDPNRPQMNKGGVVGKVKQMCAKGGVIEGEGGPKDDKINAKVKPGSFVVPAENTKVAETLREKLLMKAPKMKADLNQKGGIGVMLSNKEHLFTPEEKEELLRKGVNVDLLAPKSEVKAVEKKSHVIFPNVIGMATGGDVVEEDTVDPKKERERIAKEEKDIADEKAKIKSEKNKISAEKNIEKHRNETMSILSGVAKRKAELEKEYSKVISGQHPDYRTDEDRRHRGLKLLDEIEGYTNKLKEVDNEYKLSKDASNYNESGEFNPKSKTDSSTESKPSDELKFEYKKDKQSDKTYEELIRKPNHFVGTDEAWKKAVDDSIAKGDTIPKEGASGKSTTTVPTKPSLKAPKVSAKLNNTSVDSLPSKPVVLQNQNIEPELKGNTVANQEIINAELADKNKAYIDKNATKRRGWADVIGNVDPTAFVGIGQTALGLNSLRGQVRPVDKAVIDPTYNANVNRSINDAKFGLSPEQRFAAEQDIQNSLNDARFAARSKGFSASDTLNQERASINDAWRNKLGLKTADTEMRMNKQMYADQQVANRANILAGNRRRSFEDAMSTFQQKQQAGSELIGAGLANTIGAYRFNKDLEAQKEANLASNAWTRQYGQTNV